MCQIEEDDDTSEQASIDDVTYSENESASLILSHVLLITFVLALKELRKSRSCIVVPIARD